MSRRARGKLELLPISAVRDWAKYLPQCANVPASSLDDDDEEELWWIAMEGIVAGWSASAAFLGEKSALDPLFRLLDVGQVDEREVSGVVAAALATFAQGERELRSRVGRTLARHGSRAVRSVAVDVLSPEDPDERALLRELAGARSEWLATKAREKLEKAGGLEWWVGRFAADPATLVTAAEAAALEPTWRRYAELFDLEEPDEAQQDELLGLLGALPSPVAAAAARVFLPAGRFAEERLAKAFLAAVRDLQAATLPVEVLAAAESHGRFRLEQALKLAAPALPLEVRRAAARDALARFEPASKEALDASDSGGIGAAMAVCGALWPAEDDPTVLFDLHERWGEADLRPYHGGDLEPALDRAADADPGLQDRFRAWLRDPEAPRFRLLWWRMYGFAKRWPAEERLALARSCLDRPVGGSVLSWAVETFEKLDPETLAARWNDPLLRPEIFRRCLDGALFVRARRELREGTLDLHEAACVALRVDRLWGGLAAEVGLQIVVSNRGEEPEEDDEEFAEDDPAAAETAKEDPEQHDEEEDAPGEHVLQARAAIAEAGGAEVLGPLSEEEWRILRALRDAAPAEKLLEWEVIRLVPLGPWHPADRAFFERCVAAMLERRQREAAAVLLYVMLANPLPEFVSLLAKFDDLLETEDDRFALERTAKIYALLYPAGAKAAPKPAAAPSVPALPTAPAAADEEDW